MEQVSEDMIEAGRARLAELTNILLTVSELEAIYLAMKAKDKRILSSSGVGELADDLRYIAAHESDPRKEERIYEAADTLSFTPQPSMELVRSWRRTEVQAIHAAISKRDWFAVEVASNTLRDSMDRIINDPHAALASMGDDGLIDRIAIRISERVSDYLNDMLEDVSASEWEEISEKLYDIGADVARTALEGKAE